MPRTQMASLALLANMAMLPSPDTTWRPPQRSSVKPSEPSLDVRIRTADPDQFRAIRDPRDWRNPWVDVEAAGYRLRSRSVPRGRLVPPSLLRRALVDLPVDDWPDGRVVVIQPPGIVSVDDIGASRAHFDRARQILAALEVYWWGWPP